MQDWFADWFETMELDSAAMDHMAPVGERLAMVGHQSSRSASVGAPAATRFGVICSFRDRLIGRFDLFQDPEEARGALGLDRWPWDDHTVAAEPFDSADALALRRELEADLAERYGGDTEPGAKPDGETVLAFLVARDGGGEPAGCGALLELGRRRGGDQAHVRASGPPRARPVAPSARGARTRGAAPRLRPGPAGDRRAPAGGDGPVPQRRLRGDRAASGPTATRRCRAASSGGCASPRAAVAAA